MMFRLSFDRTLRWETRNLCNVHSNILHVLSTSLLYNFTFANYTTKSHYHRNNNNNNNYSSNAVGLNTKAPALILIETFWWLYYYRTWFSTCPAAAHPFACLTKLMEPHPSKHMSFIINNALNTYFARVEMHPLVG